MKGKVWTIRSAALAVALAGLGLTAMSFGVAAQEIKLPVTATIVKRATVKVLAQPATVVVTAADVERGYVEVPGRAQLSVRSNSQAGYMLVFASAGDFVRQMRVRGLGNEVQIGPGGGVVPLSGSARSVTQATLELGFRFELAADARQGTYAWPVQISVTPI
jgi:hypothetical protein